MPQFLIDLQNNLKGIWSRLDGGQRLIVVAVMSVAVIGLGAILWFAGQPAYVVVFSAKNGADLREAKRLLSQANVPFVPDETGQSLRVERDRYGAARSAILEGGLDASEDRSLLGGTIIEDSETKRFRLDNAARALAEHAIATLEGVQSATVVATRPRRSAFVDGDNDVHPSATVSLRLRHGAAFEAVARSAASLTSSQLMVPMENVDVVNAANSQHWRYDPDRAAGGGSNEFLAQQRAIGQERSRLAQEALDAIHPGKTRVTVAVDLDPQWEIRSERVLPDQPVAISDKTMKDATESRDPRLATGDPSATATPAVATAPTSTMKKETRDREFLHDIGERRTGKLAPEIRRISVALLYDRALEQKTGFDKAELERVVKAIVGFRDGKDAISSYAGEFVEPELAGAAAGPGLLDGATAWLPVAGQVLGVVLVLLFLKGLLKSPPRRAEARAAAAAPDPAAAEQALPAEEQQRRMRKEIERAIEADPAALAKMLEAWLAEQRT
jgi:flagellar biosynthesis/type III secretory pathway M-ring protein FliF/YscJ